MAKRQAEVTTPQLEAETGSETRSSDKKRVTMIDAPRRVAITTPGWFAPSVHELQYMLARHYRIKFAALTPNDNGQFGDPAASKCRGLDWVLKFYCANRGLVFMGFRRPNLVLRANGKTNTAGRETNTLEWGPYQLLTGMRDPNGTLYKLLSKSTKVEKTPMDVLVFRIQKEREEPEFAETSLTPDEPYPLFEHLGTVTHDWAVENAYRPDVRKLVDLHFAMAAVSAASTTAGWARNRRMCSTRSGISC